MPILVRQLLAAIVALVLLVPAQAALPSALGGQPLPSLAPLLERVTPAVVNILTQSTVQVRQNPLLDDPFFRHFFDIPSRPRERKSQNLGSGVIVDADAGLILTNHHVIKDADTISVNLRDGRRLSAQLIGADPDSDIAVVKVDAQNLTALGMADSDQLRVGDFVVAIGNPFGLGQTVTSGIVSALGRSGLGIEGYENFIQTDASINPGNSGGALINLRGELIGINTAILSGSGGNIGIGFAIPINMVREVMSQLVEYGEIRRGKLGVAAQDLTAELATAFGIDVPAQGAVITHVTAGSPAAQSGLQAGDIVTAANGRSVRGADDLRNLIGLLRIGTRVTLTVVRDGRARQITAVIAAPEQQQLSGGKLHRRLAGAQLAPIPEDSPAFGQISGIAIMAVEPGSPAQRAGLRAGDIITSINRQEVDSLHAAQRASTTASGRILLNLVRGRTALFLLLE